MGAGKRSNYVASDFGIAEHPLKAWSKEAHGIMGAEDRYECLRHGGGNLGQVCCAGRLGR